METKLSNPLNPKDAIATNKIPMHLWPSTATAMGAIGLLDGRSKYGQNNWREAGARASVYVSACQRHLAAWYEGEDSDPDSNLPHLAHALACLAILVDAQAAGKLIDDRQYPGGYRKLMNELTPLVAMVNEVGGNCAESYLTIHHRLPVRQLCKPSNDVFVARQVVPERNQQFVVWDEFGEIRF